jgi:hypothetical protein
VTEKLPLESIERFRIHFKNQNDEEKGFYSLMVSGIPVHGLPNHRYVVSKLQCKLLEDKGIEYEKD